MVNDSAQPVLKLISLGCQKLQELEDVSLLLHWINLIKKKMI